MRSFFPILILLSLLLNSCSNKKAHTQNSQAIHAPVDFSGDYDHKTTELPKLAQDAAEAAFRHMFSKTPRYLEHQAESYCLKLLSLQPNDKFFSRFNDYSKPILSDKRYHLFSNLSQTIYPSYVPIKKHLRFSICRIILAKGNKAFIEGTTHNGQPIQYELSMNKRDVKIIKEHRSPHALPEKTIEAIHVPTAYRKWIIRGMNPKQRMKQQWKHNEHYGNYDPAYRSDIPPVPSPPDSELSRIKVKGDFAITDWIEINKDDRSIPADRIRRIINRTKLLLYLENFKVIAKHRSDPTYLVKSIHTGTLAVIEPCHCVNQTCTCKPNYEILKQTYYAKDYH
mgnify:CR=1 FL=1